MLKHKTIFKSAQQNSASIVIKCPLAFSGEPFLFLFFFSFLSLLLWHAVVAYLLWSICSSMESVWNWSDPLAASLIIH